MTRIMSYGDTFDIYETNKHFNFKHLLNWLKLTLVKMQEKGIYHCIFITNKPFNVLMVPQA